MLAELRYWSEFESWKVIGAIRRYIDGELHLQGFNEKYLRGIVRMMKPAEEQGRGGKQAGSACHTKNGNGTATGRLFNALPEAERELWRSKIKEARPEFRDCPTDFLDTLACSKWEAEVGSHTPS